jgi:hypothetical protein
MPFGITLSRTRIITCALIVLALCAAVVIRGVRAQSVPRRIYLTAGQEGALTKIDEAIKGLADQYQSMANQKTAVIAGYALSDGEISKLGLEWSKEYKFVKVDGKLCFEQKSAEDKAKDAKAAADAAAGTQPIQ